MPEDFDWTPFEGDRWTAQEIGDEIIGTVRAITTKEGRGGPVPVLTVETKEGAEKEVWASTDLQRKLSEHAPQVGDMVAMKLIELKHTGQPSPMKIFAVKVKKSDSLPALAADYDEDEAPF